MTTVVGQRRDFKMAATACNTEEIVFRCLKHYLCNIICQHGIYQEDKMVGSN